MFTRLPLCNPTPEKDTGPLFVCCCNTLELNNPPFRLASGEIRPGPRSHLRPSYQPKHASRSVTVLRGANDTRSKNRINSPLE